MAIFEIQKDELWVFWLPHSKKVSEEVKEEPKLCQNDLLYYNK